MGKEELFNSYKGKVLKIFLKNGIKKEGKLIESKDGFLLINDIYQGEIGIDINQISDYILVRGENDQI